jgi:hypothetical protein
MSNDQVAPQLSVERNDILDIVDDLHREMKRASAIESAMRGLLHDYEDISLEGLCLFQLERVRALILLIDKLQRVCGLPRDLEPEGAHAQV